MFGQSRFTQIFLIHFMHIWQILWRTVWILWILMEDMMTMLSADISLSGTGQYQCGISWLLAVPMVQAVFLGIHGVMVRVDWSTWGFAYYAAGASENQPDMLCGTLKSPSWEDTELLNFEFMFHNSIHSMLLWVDTSWQIWQACTFGTLHPCIDDSEDLQKCIKM